MRDVKPVFVWAIGNGEAKIVDRILVRILPQLLKSNANITTSSIEESEAIEVAGDIYELVKQTAEELVGASFNA